MQIRRILPSHSPEEAEEIRRGAVSALSSAFKSDPVWSWMFEPAGEAGLEHWIAAWDCVSRVSARLAHPSLGLFCAFDPETKKPIGAQIWWPPHDELGILDLLRSGLLGVAFRLGFSSIRRLFRLMHEMEPHHQEIMGDTPHCYLHFIGVHQDYQVKGRGSAMARYITDVIDACGLPAYVESSNPANVSFYERLGFTVVREIRVGTCPPITLLTREAAGQTSPEMIEATGRLAHLLPEQQQMATELVRATIQDAGSTRRLLLIGAWAAAFLFFLYLCFVALSHLLDYLWT